MIHFIFVIVAQSCMTLKKKKLLACLLKIPRHKDRPGALNTARLHTISH